jgi:hypothetical protein
MTRGAAELLSAAKHSAMIIPAGTESSETDLAAPLRFAAIEVPGMYM